MGCSHQNANKLAAKLLKEGYIASVRDEDDHRKQRLSLTDKAKDFLSCNKEEAYKCVTDIFSVVSEMELEAMTNLQIEIFCLVGAAATFIVGYALALLCK